MNLYDYLIIGSGLYGATFAQQAHAAGKSVLVIDKRPHIAGNVYTEQIEGINVHKYSTLIFHTDNKTAWNYLINSPNSTVSRTAPLRTIKASSIHSHSICTPLIKCGE